MQIQFDCFYMSVSHACKVKYRSSHPIQIKFGSLMRLTIVYVCAKFHKNRFNSYKVMTDPIRVGGGGDNTRPRRSNGRRR